MAAATGGSTASDAALARATALNREGLTSYERGDFEEARQAIKQALAVCVGAGLQQHPLYARTLLHLGIVLVGGLNQRQAGIAEFRKALALQPGITLNSNLASPELVSAFQEASRTMPAAGTTPSSPTAPGAETTDAAAPESLVHTPVKEGKRRSAILITVVVQNALKFDRIVLAYRKADGDEFLGRPMKSMGGGSYTAEIPSGATAGEHVLYFVEALDADGTVVAARGSVEAPLVITLGGDRRDEGQGEDSNEGDLPARRWMVAMAVGSGVGVASGTGDLNADVMTSHAHLAPAQLFHLAPEVGYWLRRSLLLSLQARLQFVTGTTDLIVADHRYHAAGGAAALFARASWMFRPQRGFQPLFSLAVGAGEIRHVVAFDYNDCGDNHRQRCVDAVAAGPVLAGAGTGFFYSLGEGWALLAQLNAQLAAPRSTLNFDLNVGAAARF
ncbi:MAG TPA: tetratricopeptide repeat protein [Polyangia bacterium]|nr:tetratricopeptide repeat protein [Polyangia bacterium]